MRVGIFSDHLAFMKKRGLCVNLLRSILTILWLITLFGRSAFAANSPLADLVESFWFSTDDSVVAISNELKDSVPDLETLYEHLSKVLSTAMTFPGDNKRVFGLMQTALVFPMSF